MSDDSRVWVGGLPERVTEEEVRDVYEKYGAIKHAEIRYNAGKCSFAFVQFDVLADAEAAVKATDQQKLFGMPFVKVAWAGKSKGGKGKGGGKGGRRSPSGGRRRSPSGGRRRSPSRRRRSPSPRRRSPSRRRTPPPGYRRSRSPRRRTPPRDGYGSRPGSRPRSPPRRSPPRRASPPRSNGNGYDRRSRSPRRPSREPQGRPRTLRITVENLPKDMESRELKEFGLGFAKAGKCSSATMTARGVGELEFTEIADMERAIKELDNRRFSGSDEKLKAYESR